MGKDRYDGGFESRRFRAITQQKKSLSAQTLFLLIFSNLPRASPPYEYSCYIKAAARPPKSARPRVSRFCEVKTSAVLPEARRFRKERRISNGCPLAPLYETTLLYHIIYDKSMYTLLQFCYLCFSLFACFMSLFIDQRIIIASVAFKSRGGQLEVYNAAVVDAKLHVYNSVFGFEPRGSD